MDSDIMAILPWGRVTLTIADITRARHARHPAPPTLAALGCDYCAPVPGRGVVAGDRECAGPAPFAPRMALLPYIRLGVPSGSVMLIGVNAVEAPRAPPSGVVIRHNVFAWGFMSNPCDYPWLTIGSSVRTSVRLSGRRCGGIGACQRWGRKQPQGMSRARAWAGRLGLSWRAAHTAAHSGGRSRAE